MIDKFSDKKWSSTSALKTAFYNARKYHNSPTISYAAKIKLHGTAAGIHFFIDKAGIQKIQPQSRNRVISVGSDNEGFAAWVAKNSMGLYEANRDSSFSGEYIVYGEWCGAGILRGASVCSLPKKVFAVFAIRDLANDTVIVDPDQINEVWPAACKLADGDFFVLPYYSFNEGPHSVKRLVVDYASAVSSQKFSNAVSAEVERIEGVDPWVKATFNVDGNGEGIVLYPVSVSNEPQSNAIPYQTFSNLFFKAKGKKHKTEKSQGDGFRNKAPLDPLIILEAEVFAEEFCTEARFQQAYSEVVGDDDLVPKMIGGFVKWMCVDVQKESMLEMEVSPTLNWNKVRGFVAARSAMWAKDKLGQASF